MTRYPQYVRGVSDDNLMLLQCYSSADGSAALEAFLLMSVVLDGFWPRSEVPRVPQLVVCSGKDSCYAFSGLAV